MRGIVTGVIDGRVTEVQVYNVRRVLSRVGGQCDCDTRPGSVTCRYGESEIVP